MVKTYEKEFSFEEMRQFILIDTYCQYAEATCLKNDLINYMKPLHKFHFEKIFGETASDEDIIDFEFKCICTIEKG